MSATLPVLRFNQPSLSVPAPTGRQGIPRDRWLLLIVFMVALTIFGATDSGRIVFDTKLGVDINAGEFLGRLWSLWNPLEWQGSLQNQYIGYAIPMAPFFLIGQLLHIPIWLIERLWLSLLMAVGFAGLLKLSRALNIGSDASRLLAAVVFILWPTFTIAIGSTSAAALPGLMVPWAVLPLVGAVKGHSPVWRSVARSGLAVAAMAGVNAVSTLAVLLLPALYILTHTRGRQRTSLSLKWCTAIIAATAWWVVPLLLQGRYAFNFLPYIEQSATTTRTMSATAVLRGTGTWTAYFDLGNVPWISAGWTLVSASGAILATATAAAVGLAGIARRDMPERRWLCTCTGITLIAALAGYSGPFGSPFHAWVDSLLDGPLAPFRSTYKLEPVIAVALALGCAHMLARTWRTSLPLWRSRRLAASAAAAPVVALVLAGLALPQLTGQALQPGSFTSVPAYWHQVSAFLARHSATETALVVPSNPHGQFIWGDTIDNPLEPLATSPWTERGLVPYGGAGSQVFLETAESAVESGHQVPGLAAYLARSGIRYIVVRNDNLPTISGYTEPQIVNETLAQSGFHRVAYFGPQIGATPGYPNVAGEAPGFALSYPSVEIFAANDPRLEPDSPVTTLPLSHTVLVNGGPDSLLQLAAPGILGGQPAVIAGQQLSGKPALWAVTDGQRRADNDFGSTVNYASYTYTATGTNPIDDPLGDAGGQPRQLLPVSAAGHQTVAVLSGAASVTASSAGSWLGESTSYDPANAFDGNPATAWAESNADTPVGQWIQINFAHKVNLPARARIELLDDFAARAVPYQLRATTETGAATTNTVASAAEQPLRLPSGPTRWLRITITAASNVVPGRPGAGISDVLIPGIHVTTYLQPAQDQFGTSAPAVAYSFSLPSPADSSQSTPATGIGFNRRFDTPAAERLTADITAVPEPGQALTSIIANLSPATTKQFQVSSSSSWDYLPSFGPANLFQQPTSRPWLASSSDPNPTLELHWHGRRTISTLTLLPALGLAAAPTGVLVGSPAGARLEPVGLGGIVRVSPPLRTDRLYLSFGPRSTSAAGNTTAGQPSELPLGLAKVTIPALAGLHPATPPATAPFRLACGQGPAVTVDGHRYQTSVTGTVGALMQLQPVHLRLCSPGSALQLPAGHQVLTSAPSSDFGITSLDLVSPPTVASAGRAEQGQAAEARRVRVLSWHADGRKLFIGAGPASYLEIHENFNPGWSATLDGRPLKAATLDGWQQAFVVPTGKGGTVALTYSPATVYHVGILISAAALLILAGLALGNQWKRRKRMPSATGAAERVATNGGSPPSEPRSPASDRGALVFNATPAGQHVNPASHLSGASFAPARATVHGHSGKHRAPGRAHRLVHLAHPSPTRPTLAHPSQAGPSQDGPSPDGPSASGRSASGPSPARTSRPTRAQMKQAVAILLPVAAVIFVAGGAVVLVVPVLAVIAYSRARWLPLIAALAMFGAGVIAAAARTPTVPGHGPFGGSAQVFALIALAAALMPVIFTAPSERTEQSGSGL